MNKFHFEKKVIILFYCLFLTCSIVVYGQAHKIDSLKILIETQKVDSTKVNMLIELSKLVLNNDDIPQSIEYAKEAMELAKEIDFKKGLAYAQKQIGLAEYYRGEYVSVFDYWTQSLETFESIQDTIGMSNMLNNLGGVYLGQGSSDKALDYFLKSLSLAEKIDNPLRITSVLPNIAAVYGQKDDYEKSLKYFNQMEQYLDVLDDPQITAYNLMGIGEVYYKMDNYDKALNFFKDALPLNENSERHPHNLKMLGDIELKRGNKDKAIDFLNESYKEAKQKNQHWDIVEALLGIGKVYEKDNYSKALSAFKEAESLAKETELNRALRDIYKGMSTTYASNGDYTNAYKYQELYIFQKDALFNLETDDKIRGLQFDFETDKQRDEIVLLKREAEITQLQDKRQNYITYASFIAAGLVLLLAIGLFRRYRYVKKTNNIIEDEKDRAEALLLNILPKETAIELQEHGKVKAKQFNDVAVLFTDFIGFTRSSSDLSPDELVKSVDFFFSKFDEITAKHGLEKIKTIGDAYMCAAGLPFPSGNHSLRAVRAAFEIAEFIEDSKKESKEQNLQHFEIRIGINTGPVVAGVVGTKKFAYDIWGNTVNVASRMESKSEQGRINISEDTYELIKDTYDCEYRGEIDVKNKGMMKMYFVNGLKNEEASNALKENKVEHV